MTGRDLRRVIAPLAAGAVLSAVLFAAYPDVRVYATASPALITVAAGLVGSALVLLAIRTRRRVAAAALSAADTARHEVAALAARDHLTFLLRLDHELKNPLTAIRAGLVNIHSDDSADGSGPPDAAAVASVSAQADRITQLVSDLRKLSDLETRPIERAEVDLYELLGEVVEASRQLPGACDRRLLLTVPQAPWPLPSLQGDRDLLFIAAQNLVSNAIKFSARGDAIEVRAREDGDTVLIEVADTGVGIPASEIGHVWQELARGQAARHLPGTGIGLALVRVIIQRHAGTAVINSREGEGTVVGFRLPIPTGATVAGVVAGSRRRWHIVGKPAR